MTTPVCLLEPDPAASLAHHSAWQLGTAPGASVELHSVERLSVVGSAGIRRGSLLLKLINGSRSKKTRERGNSPDIGCERPFPPFLAC